MKYNVLFIVTFLIATQNLYLAGSEAPEYDETIKYGALLYQSDSLDKAIKTFETACREYPDSAQALNALGSVLIRKGILMTGEGNHSEANKILKRASRSINTAILLDSSYAFAYYNKGIIYLKLNLPKKAERTFRKVVTLEPDNIPAYQHLGYALNKQYSSDNKNIYDAIKIWRQALEIDSTCPEAVQLHIEIGRALYISGNTDEAKIEFNKALYIDSTNPDALFGLGQVYDDLEESISIYARAVKYDSSKGRFYNAIGNMHHIQRDLFGAIKAWQKVTTIPGSSVFQKAYAYKKIAIDLDILATIMRNHRDVNFQMAKCLNRNMSLCDKTGFLFSTRGQLNRAIAEYIEKIGKEYTKWYNKVEEIFYMSDSIGKKLEELEIAVILDENEASVSYRLAVYQHILATIAHSERDGARKKALLLHPKCSISEFKEKSPLKPLETKFICSSHPISRRKKIIIQRIVVYDSTNTENQK